MTKRTLRIDELLREEIGAILTREVDDPRIGFATVTDVETAPDLSHARVWVSVIGQPDERDATMAALGRAMPFVRRQLGGRIKLRRIPELHVRLDESLQRGTRVLRLLSELESGAAVDPPGPAGESLPTPVARLPHEGDAPGAGPDPSELAAPPRRRRRRGTVRPPGTNRRRR